MTIEVRLVTLSGSADELCRSQAKDAGMAPEIYLSLLAEMAIRERHALEQNFAAALAKVASAK